MSNGELSKEEIEALLRPSKTETNTGSKRTEVLTREEIDQLLTAINKEGPSPEMEQLIAENKALKEEIAVLRETNQALLDLTDTYDKELNNATDLLKQVTDNLNEATGIINRLTAEDEATHT